MEYNIFTVPLLSKGAIDSCISVVTIGNLDQNSSSLLNLLQWFTILFYNLDEEKKREQEKLATMRIAGIVEAINKSTFADDLPQASAQLVETFRGLADCERVVIATKRLGRVRIQAISGVPQSQIASSEGCTAMETLLREAIRQNLAIAGGMDSSGLVLPEAEALRAQKTWCIPLVDRDKTIGVWLFLWKTVPEDFEERIRFLETASDLMGPHLGILRQTKPGALIGSVRRLWRRAAARQKTLVVCILFALGLFALMPIPIGIKAACTLQPESRRIVSAPFDGVLRKTLVSPGEEVKQGQLLAELDAREIRWKLADATAQKQRAEKEADVAIGEGRVADSQIAWLEAASLNESGKVLSHRQENLHVKSPITGRILQGDLERAEGATVRMGETLFEVGSLETMNAEIEVLESDISLIQSGAPVKLRFDSRPGESWTGSLNRIAPRSEFRNGANVFICEVSIENKDKGLRPGGLGRARIDGPQLPAIWSILRKPVSWILQRMP